MELQEKGEIQRMLVVLDLDETLLHADDSEAGRESACDFSFEEYRVRLRPGLEGFLRRMAAIADLAIWSSSTHDYLAAMLAQFPWQPQWGFTWHRGHCTLKRDLERDSYVFTKNLDKLTRMGFCLDRVLIVDDSPEKIPRHYGNLVPMPPFHGDPADTTLSLLAAYLETLVSRPGIRRIEKRHWMHSS
jgi:carboxy-terminal domain RNA polymerase II polypeptide A small phosphatase